MADIMVNPEIPLGIRPPQPVAPGGGLELIGQFAGAQRSLLEAESLSQQIAARRTAGQIISQSADPQAAVKALMANPQTAGWAQDIIGSMANTNTALTSAAGLLQDQAQSGLKATYGAMSAAFEDPKLFGPAVNAALGAMSPQARAKVAPQVAAMTAALTDGLPSDPQAALAEYEKRVAAITTGAGGVDPGTIRAMSGAVAPSISMQPTGPGGALEPVQMGGPMTGPSGATSLAGGGVPRGVTPEETARQAGEAQVATDITKNVSADAESLPSTLKSIDMMQGALGDFQAGGGADARASLAKAMQALKNIGLPIKQSDIDGVANSNLSATQLFNAEVKPMMMRKMREDIRGTGNSTQAEIKSYLEAMDSTTDPNTLMSLLNQAKFELQLSADRATKWPEFRQMVKSGKTPYDYSDFNNWYLQQYQEKGLPTELPSGQPIGPAAPSNAKGAQGSARPSLQSIFGF